MKKCINIEIVKGYKDNAYTIRFGDQSGSITRYNLSITELLSEVKDSLMELE